MKLTFVAVVTFFSISLSSCASLPVNKSNPRNQLVDRASEMYKYLVVGDGESLYEMASERIRSYMEKSEYAERIRKFIAQEARKKSMEFGKERGNFPNFKKSRLRHSYQS